jgi:hypothetical protein
MSHLADDIESDALETHAESPRAESGYKTLDPVAPKISLCSRTLRFPHASGWSSCEPQIDTLSAYQNKGSPIIGTIVSPIVLHLLS